jgi:hypothetical protein
MEMSEIPEVNGSLTAAERAAQIATLEQLGLLEFTELTGVGAGRYGVFRVSESGITFDQLPLEDLPVSDQIALQRAVRELSLRFPCSPEQLMEWHTATRGTNSVSDFDLAPAFEAEMRRRNPEVGARASCPADAVVKAFAVRPTAAANKKWWDARLRDPRKYGLVAGRALKGKAKRPSRWYPDVVAGWLVDKQHMSHSAVTRAVEQHFPDVDVLI